MRQTLLHNQTCFYNQWSHTLLTIKWNLRFSVGGGFAVCWHPGDGLSACSELCCQIEAVCSCWSVIQPRRAKL